MDAIRNSHAANIEKLRQQLVAKYAAKTLEEKKLREKSAEDELAKVRAEEAARVKEETEVFLSHYF